MLRVSTTRDKLTTEHTKLRVAQVSDSKCRLVMDGMSYDFLLTMNRWPEPQPLPLAECATRHSGSAVPGPKTTS
jgi:hypothetical protein